MTATMAPRSAASGPKQPVDVEQARKHTDDRRSTERPSADEALSVEATDDKSAPQCYRDPAEVAITLTPETAHGDSGDEEFTALDITERKQLEQEREQLAHELELAVKARDEFVAVLSHDLRSPIHTISLTAESLLTQLPDNLVEERKRVQAIRRAAAHATRMIEDLLQEITAPAGDLLLSIEPHDPRAIVSDVAAMFEPAPSQRGASLAVEILGDPSLVLCDRSSILRVFENLVGNAKKFTSAQGVITLRVEAGVDTVKFSVTDPGPGIPAEEAARLFERGCLGNRVGLGLAIVKRIVEAHGGAVGVESTVARGSTFWFVLPAA